MIGYIILSAAMLLLFLHAFSSITPEGETLYYGFNFYPWSERKRHLGFRFKYSEVGMIWFRYSGHTKKFSIKNFRYNKEDLKTWEQSSR